MKEKNPNKYFVKIQKAYERDGDWVVEGVAGGTLLDDDGQKVSVKVLKQFLARLPMPLSDAHPSMGPIMGNVGTVVEGRIQLVPGMDDEFELYIKAILDRDNPAAEYLMKKIQEGRNYGFSIDGDEPITKTVYDKKSDKFVTEFISCMPNNISVTTEPAYTRSFVKVAQKALRKEKGMMKRDELTTDEKGVDIEKGKTDNNSQDNLNETIMAKNKKAEKAKLKKSEGASEEPEKTDVENTDDATQEESKENAEEVIEENEEGKEEVEETEEGEEAGDKVEKEKKDDKKKMDKKGKVTLGSVMKALDKMAKSMELMAEGMAKSSKRSRKMVKLMKSQKKEMKTLQEALNKSSLGKKSLSKEVKERQESNVFAKAANDLVE